MGKNYKLVFVYPDGHIEEIDNLFSDLDSAKMYGETLLGQVYNTESFINTGDDEEFGFSKKIDPYFMVVELGGKKYRLVYESKH